MRHFRDLADAGSAGLRAILDEASARKFARGKRPKGRPDDDAPLAGHVLAMIFEKSSTRTRVSFDMAIRQLGGSALVLDSGGTQLGRGETIADTARVLSRYVDAVMIRTDDHAKLLELGEHATVPVINGLTDRSHPCQIVADLLTIEEGDPYGRTNALAGSRWAWLGDGNNVLHSIIEAAGLIGFHVSIGVPEGYDPDPGICAEARRLGADISIHRNARSAVAGADFVVTDSWISMGQDHADEKLAAMLPFQVTDALLEKAKPNAHFLHCLPAHRGEEVTASVIDGPRSLVFDEAENRLHAQKAILLWCFGMIG